MPVMFVSIFYNTPRFFELEVYQLQPGNIESSTYFPSSCSDANSNSNSINSLLLNYFFQILNVFHGCRTVDFCLAPPFHFAVVFSRQSQSTVFAEEVENIFLPKIIISPIKSTPSQLKQLLKTHFRFLLVFLFHCFLIYICIVKVSEQFLFSWQKK